MLVTASVMDDSKLLPRGLVEANERILLEAGRLSPRGLRFFRSSLMVWFTSRVDTHGAQRGVALRKAFCDREVHAAIEGGATQVLVLGAGYDTLCWRLAAEFPAVRFIEVDHPATSAPKQRAIEAMGRPDNMTMVSADLGATPLPDVLARVDAWTADDRTIVVAEGLLYYLTGADVVDLFREAAACTGGGSRIAFSYMKPGGPGTGGWVTLGLRLMGEPWIWFITPDELPAFLRPVGWQLRPLTAGSDIAGLDRLAVAERS